MKIFLTLLIISFDENQTDKEISPNICQNDYRQKHHKDKEKINYYKNHQIIKEGSKRRIEEENSHKTWRK